MRIASDILLHESRAAGTRGLLAGIVAAAWVSSAFAGTDEIDYTRDIRPILADKCFHCHGPDAEARQADLRLDAAEAAYDMGAIVPGDVEASEMFRRITSTDDAEKMPPPDSERVLSAKEIETLRRWIESGAKYRGHWAYEPIRNPDVPQSDKSPPDWKRNPIDAFIFRGLQEAGLTPSEPTSREELLRRVTFDLTGLPPTIEEIDAFLADDSPEAYERVVERLLASPHFGERFAQDWLDLASYSDTFGYSADRERPHWYWRDWVIKAFNDNMPYDQFVTWQLAGDLLPNATRDQIVATGFGRNHPQNAEGGIIEEEFRSEYVASRAETFGTAFLGLTVGCARCHDHKFDAISQEDFYKLYSFFNNVDEAAQVTWLIGDVASPTIMLPTPEQERQQAALEKKVAAAAEAVEQYRNTARQELQKKLAGPERKQLLADAAPTDMLAHYPLTSVKRDDIPNAVQGGPNGVLYDTVDKGVAAAELEVVEGTQGPGLRLNGDDALTFQGVGRFSRAQPFTVAMWVWVPKDLRDGVIFHAMESSVLYRYRGYHVAVEGGKFDVRLAHDFPYNSIHFVSKQDAPQERWIHVALAYDGSSKAAGVRLYVDGEEFPCDLKRDNLYKDIIFGKAADKEPEVPTRLQVGARWRDKGLSDGLVDEIYVFGRRLSAIEIASLVGRTETFDSLAADSTVTVPADLALLEELALARDESYAKLYSHLTASRLELAEHVDSYAECMVMAELPTPRPAHILKRGAYDAPTTPVSPGTPQAVLEYSDELPKNRLGLAQWLFKAENPLTARVAVNRYWQLFFGRGLVETAEDFGVRGSLPSHPELLDWLATSFRESGWDVKQLARQIVTSATYRQCSRADEIALAKDPANVLLSRGISSRLPAENIRDLALASSGLLVRTIGGPSVKPYQPDGLWSINAFSRDYIQDQGDGLYRRSLYTVWKRTNPPPTMNLFDAPSRSYCVVRRERTATPLQALVLINDPQFVEAARVMAERAVKKHPQEPTERWIEMFRSLTSRAPEAAEVAVLDRMYAAQRAYFEGDAKSTDEFLAVGEWPVDESLSKADVAASAMVASAILSLDETTRKP